MRHRLNFLYMYMSVTPLTKYWGPGAPRPLSALLFPEHLILGQNRAQAAPDDLQAGIFLECVQFIIGPYIRVQIFVSIPSSSAEI